MGNKMHPLNREYFVNHAITSISSQSVCYRDVPLLKERESLSDSECTKL